MGNRHWSMVATLTVAATAAAACMVESASAQFGRPQQHRPQSADELVTARLAADVTSIQPGETFHLVAVFEIRPTWHVYWRNPGEGAAPTSVELTLPDGFEAGKARWPRPKRSEGMFGDVFSYERETAIFFPVTAPAELDETEAVFSARMSFAVCDDRMCLFGDMTRQHTLPITANASSHNRPPRYAETIARHRENLPRPIEQDGNASVEARRDGTVLHISGPVLHAGTDKPTIAFIPHDSPGVKYGKASVDVDGDRFSMRIPLEIDPVNFIDSPPNVGGLVTFGDDHNGPSYEIDVPFPANAIPKD